MGQAAVFVTEADGDTIDFRFDDKFGFLAVEILFHAIEKVAELLLAVGVVEALHSHGVGDGAEGVEGCATNFSGGGIFIREFGMGGLD